MEVNEVNRERWPFQLAPQLTGKAQQAYAALNPDDAKIYDTVKAAILRDVPTALPYFEAKRRGITSRADDAAPGPMDEGDISPGAA